MMFLASKGDIDGKCDPMFCIATFSQRQTDSNKIE